MRRKMSGITETPRRMKAMTRVAQGAPILGSRSLNTIGSMMPATGEPIDVTPDAKARRVVKYCAMMAVQGPKTRPHPTPMHMP